jgi:hypothetical protein
MGLFTRNNDCKHLWGPIEEGYQYCTKCGMARIVECRHEWEIEKEGNISRTDRISGNENVIGRETVYICKICTQRKYVRTQLDEEPVVKLI